MHANIPSRVQALVLASSLFLAAAAQPLVASADGFINFPGHSWPYAGSGLVLSLNYARDCAGSFLPNADAAASSWSATPTPILFTNVSSTDCSGGAHEGVSDVYVTALPDPYMMGTTQNFGQSCFFFGGCLLYPTYNEQSGGGGDAVPIVASVITMNLNATYAKDEFVRQGALAHEFGHSMGLGHCYYAEFGCHVVGTKSIMDGLFGPVTYSFNKPQQWDIDHINTLYPGW
jgi:hypothetical protein